MNGRTPVMVGQELDVKIEAVGEKGDGIARVEGFVLFVPNTKEGDEVRVRITKVLRKVGFAEVVGKAGEEAPAEEKETFGEEEAPAEEKEPFGEEEPEEEAPKEEVPAEEEVPVPPEEFKEE